VHPTRCGCRRRIDRMLATDPKEQARARPTAKCSRRDVKTIPSRPTVTTNRASNPLGRLRGSSAPRRRRNRSTTGPSCTPEPSFFTPQASGAFSAPNWHRRLPLERVASGRFSTPAAPLFHRRVPRKLIPSDGTAPSATPISGCYHGREKIFPVSIETEIPSDWRSATLPSFTITAASQKVTLVESGAAQVPFTVTNTSAQTVRGRLSTKPLEPAKSEWLSVIGESVRDFRASAAEQVIVQIRVPSGTPSGSYSFRLVAISETAPDEDFTKGPDIAFDVAASTPKRRFPWWLVRRHRALRRQR
jgi:hypothetical protein